MGRSGDFNAKDLYDKYSKLKVLTFITIFVF